MYNIDGEKKDLHIKDIIHLSIKKIGNHPIFESKIINGAFIFISFLIISQ